VTPRDAVTGALLVTGTLLELFAVLGLVAMRDALSRLHYVGLAGYGLLLVGVAVLVRQSFSLIGDKALAVGVLGVALGPIVAHATARSLRIRAHGHWNAPAESEGEP
jgi:multisubunit Na+/H+ antiporter MnhG subunit